MPTYRHAKIIGDMSINDTENHQADMPTTRTTNTHTAEMPNTDTLPGTTLYLLYVTYQTDMLRQKCQHAETPLITTDTTRPRTRQICQQPTQFQEPTNTQQPLHT